MVRQTLFAAVLGLALALPFKGAAQPAQNGSPASPARRPVPDIAFSRLTPDAAVSVALEPGAVASPDAIWTTARSIGAIVRLDVQKNAADPPAMLGATPCGSLVVAFTSVWVPLCSDRTIARVDPKTARVTGTLKMGLGRPDSRLAEAVGSVWMISEARGVLSRIDPDSNAAVAELHVKGAAAIAAGEDALWVTSDESNQVIRINPHNNETVEIIDVGPKPGPIAVGESGVWIFNRGDGSVTRVDPASNKAVATIPAAPAGAAGDIATGAGSVWISVPGTPIIRIDPRTNRSVQKFTGEGGGAILVAHGSVWVASGPKLTWRLDPLLVAAVRP